MYIIISSNQSHSIKAVVTANVCFPRLTSSYVGRFVHWALFLLRCVYVALFTKLRLLSVVDWALFIKLCLCIFGYCVVFAELRSLSFVSAVLFIQRDLHGGWGNPVPAPGGTPLANYIPTPSRHWIRTLRGRGKLRNISGCHCWA